MTARQQIKRHEGLRLKPYADTVGKLTIGYGHNLSGNGISQKVAEKVFREDYLVAEADARLTCGNSLWGELNRPRRAVLVNMAFNLGLPRLKRFKRMIRALEFSVGCRAAGRSAYYALAAKEMLDSKWSREDVPTRSFELAEQMRTGRWAKVA